MRAVRGIMPVAGESEGFGTTTITTPSELLDGFQWRIFPPPLPPRGDHGHRDHHLVNGNQQHYPNKKRKRQKSTSPSSSSSSLSPYCSHQLHHIPNKTIVLVKETNDFRRLACQVNSRTTTMSTAANLTLQNDRDEERHHEGCRGGGDDDHVLEVGCSSGGLSKLILRRRPLSWVGIDNSQEMIDRCQKNLKDVFVHANDTTRTKLVRIDVLSEPTKAYGEIVNLAAAAASATEKTTTTDDTSARDSSDNVSTVTSTTTSFPSSPTVVFVDIGGNRDDISVLKVLEWVFNIRAYKESGKDELSSASASSSSSSPLRLVIVKSRALVESMLSSSSGGKIGVSSTGVVSDGSGWFREALAERVHNVRPSLPKHPLKAPMVFAPIGDGTTPICRYHNYHVRGCWKYNSVTNRRRNNDNNNKYDPNRDDDTATASSQESGNDKNDDAVHHICPFDHDHCHACLQRGHRARDCSFFFVQHKRQKMGIDEYSGFDETKCGQAA